MLRRGVARILAQKMASPSVSSSATDAEIAARSCRTVLSACQTLLKSFSCRPATSTAARAAAPVINHFTVSRSWAKASTGGRTAGGRVAWGGSAGVASVKRASLDDACGL